MEEALNGVTILLIILVFIVLKRTSKIIKWSESINEDLYDIREKLSLPVVVRTKSRRYQKIIAFIDEMVESGRDKKYILGGIKTLSGTYQWGDASLGRIKPSQFEKYIDYKIINDAHDQKGKVK